METWITTTVRRRCVRCVTAWALALACLAFFSFRQQRYLRNFAFGPYDLTPAELESIHDISQAPRYFARVKGSRVIKTGIQHITVRKRNGVETGRSVTGAYYILVVGDKFLICKSGSEPKTELVGELAPYPPSLRRSLFGNPNLLAMQSRFLPFYLNNDSFRPAGYIAIAGCLVFFFLARKYALPAWNCLRNPAAHPLVARVAAWGDPIGVAVEAERESQSPRYKGAGWVVTDRFLIQSSFFTFNVLRLSDLLWAYKTVTQHRVNFVPTHKTYNAVLFCYGGAATIQSKDETTDQILAFARERAPWALFGFSKELQTLFKNKPPEFYAVVEQRKRDLAEGRAQRA